MRLTKAGVPIPASPMPTSTATPDNIVLTLDSSAMVDQYIITGSTFNDVSWDVINNHNFTFNMTFHVNISIDCGQFLTDLQILYLTCNQILLW